jgi:ParB family chromosome partitioning protein
MSENRATFAAAAFAHLRAAAGDGSGPGPALRLRLSDIDEDPDQPRTLFDGGDLEALAETIRAHGVVQPVVVRPPVAGRYRLVAGARRLRASRLAGLADILAVIRAAETGAASPSDLVVQIIENQHRSGLANSDLAAAIERLVAQGATNGQIAAVCALKDYQVPAFRQARHFPTELAHRMDNADMRALYELYRQWTKTPAAVLAALPDLNTFLTVSEARRIVGALTDQPRSSPVSIAPGVPLDKTMVEPAESTPCAPPPIPAELGPPPAGNAKGAENRHVIAALAEDTKPVFIVAADDGRTGRLVLDRRAGHAGQALVAYASGLEAVEATRLQIVRVE